MSAEPMWDPEAPVRGIERERAITEHINDLTSQEDWRHPARPLSIAALIAWGAKLDPPLVEDDLRRRLNRTALRHANRRLRLEGHQSMVRVIKRDRRDADFDLLLADGTIVPLGGTREVLKRASTEAAIADATGHTPPPLGREDYREVAAIIIAVAEIDEDAATPEQQTLDWLAEYVPSGRWRDVDLEDREEVLAVISRRDPFYDTTGRLHVHGDDFTVWLTRGRGIRLAPGDKVTTRLARAGFVKEQLSAREDHGGNVRKRRMWVSSTPFDAGSATPPRYTQEADHFGGDTGDTGTSRGRGGSVETPSGDGAGTAWTDAAACGSSPPRSPGEHTNRGAL